MKMLRALFVGLALLAGPAYADGLLPGGGSGFTLPTTASAGTLTTSQSMLGITGTWNNSGVTFPGALSVNVTDTASASGSLLADLQVGGVSKFKVDKSGNIVFAGVISGLGNSGALAFGSASTCDGFIPVGTNNARFAYCGPSGGIEGVYIAAGVPLGFSNAASVYGANVDTHVYREGAGVLSLQDGTQADSFRVYNTWSSSGTNYERGVFDWQTNPNVLTIGTQNGGTGVARNLEVVVGGVNKLDYGISVATQWTIHDQLNAANGITSGGNILTQTNLVINGAGSLAWNNSSYIANVVNGVVKVSNSSNGTGAIVTVPGTIATLPAAATAGAGARAFVTDATACTFGSAVTGGGSVKCPVYTDGTSWLAGG